MRFGIWELLVILLIVALLFGTKKLRSLGTDLGSALKGFRGAMRDDEEDDAGKPQPPEGRVIEGEAQEKQGGAPRDS